VRPRIARELHARGIPEVLRKPQEHAPLLSPPALARLRSGQAGRAADAELARAQKLGVALVALGSQAYPRALSEIYDPPLVVYVKGRLLPDEGARSVAIVGSRAASPAGRALARALAADLAAENATIVSGLARGIDTEAHEGALERQGRTIAVLGTGVDVVYPPENAALAEQIAETGALVSEFPLGAGPRPQNFPTRNRILAGLSRGVVVVEAAEKSGALVTARLSLDAGREVMAVPGHPSQPLCAGTNALIRDGARLVRNAEDVLLEIELPGSGSERSQPARASGLLDALRRDAPLSVDDLAQKTGRPVPELLAELSELELASRIRRLPGALFVRG
jgi:DNA processing protein